MTVEVPQSQLLDDGMVGYRWAWCLVRLWIHGLRQLLGAFGWVLHIFYVMVFSDSEVDAAMAPGSSAVPGSHDEPMTWYDEVREQ